MPKLVSIAQMQALEAAAVAQGLPATTLLANAGAALASFIAQRSHPALAQQNVLVLVGAGNNGNDGLVAARHLAQAGATVRLYLSRALPPDQCWLQAALAAGAQAHCASADPDFAILSDWLAEADLLLDALVGIGARLPLSPALKALLQHVRQQLRQQPPHTTTVIAVDCPSGYDCDNGNADSATLPAHITATFGAYKHGLLAACGETWVGELVCLPIGWEVLPQWEMQPAWQALPHLLAQSDIAAQLPKRSRFAHKGSFGRVLVWAGCTAYAGAAYLAAAGAYRAGAGLVQLASVPTVHTALLAHLPEAIWLPLAAEQPDSAAQALQQAAQQARVVLFGPGLGQDSSTQYWLERFVATLQHGQAAVICDADALTWLAQQPNWWQKLPSGSILTPHPGEFARLTGLSTTTIQAERLAIAQRCAQQWGHVVVLKGAYTVIAAPDGRVAVSPFATAALAKAGSGDVLAGMTAGLLAQGLDSFAAACTAVYLHAAAGSHAAAQQRNTFSVLASDILAALPVVLGNVIR